MDQNFLLLSKARHSHVLAFEFRLESSQGAELPDLAIPFLLNALLQLFVRDLDRGVCVGYLQDELLVDELIDRLLTHYNRIILGLILAVAVVIVIRYLIRLRRKSELQ